MAEQVVNYLVDEKLGDSIEYSEKTKSYKLKINPSDVPENIAVVLRNCTKTTSTVFGGKLGVRVRLLPTSLLSPELRSKMRSLTETIKFEDAVKKIMDGKEADHALFGREFFKQVKR